MKISRHEDKFKIRHNMGKMVKTLFVFSEMAENIKNVVESDSVLTYHLK